MSSKSRKIRRANAAEAILQVRLTEAVQWLDQVLIDPMEDNIDPDTGEMWVGVGGGSTPDTYERRYIPRNEGMLRQVRILRRDLADENPFAICGHENRINYIVGSGHTYSVEPKRGETVGDDEIETIEVALDAFLDENNWHQRQQEIVHRKDRDGEVFLRLFLGADGKTRVRFVQPIEVAQPPGNVADTFGIKTDPDDVKPSRDTGLTVNSSVWKRSSTARRTSMGTSSAACRCSIRCARTSAAREVAAKHERRRRDPIGHRPDLQVRGRDRVGGRAVRRQSG